MIPLGFEHLLQIADGAPEGIVFSDNVVHRVDADASQNRANQTKLKEAMEFKCRHSETLNVTRQEHGKKNDAP